MLVQAMAVTLKGIGEEDQQNNFHGALSSYMLHVVVLQKNGKYSRKYS